MMSLRVATVRGIPIRVHLSLLVIYLVLVSQLGVWGVPAGLLLSGSVLAHELGHALVAQRFGIPIARIDLHLFGGTAMMERVPERPRDELLVALAGPLVSLLLGGLGFAILLPGGPFELAPPTSAGALLPFFAATNLGMAVFNLLPALPMDGGRVLRALLAMRLGMVHGTRIAARVARALAVAFVLFGVYVGAWALAGFGVMVYVLAGREVALVEWRARWVAQQAAQQAAWRVVDPFFAWRAGRATGAWSNPLAGEPGGAAGAPRGFGGASEPGVVIDVTPEGGPSRRDEGEVVVPHEPPPRDPSAPRVFVATWTWPPRR
jgi:Zn-dependent protease